MSLNPPLRSSPSLPAPDNRNRVPVCDYTMTSVQNYGISMDFAFVFDSFLLPLYSEL